jgi:hypothetical protein
MYAAIEYLTCPLSVLRRLVATRHCSRRLPRKWIAEHYTGWREIRDIAGGDGQSMEELGCAD